VINSTRLWVIGAAILMVAILALGYFVGVSPKLAEASAAAAQMQQADSQNASEQATVDKLRGEYNNMSALTAKLATLQLAIPSTPDGNGMVQEISAAASQSGVQFTSITFGEPVPFASSASTSAVPPTTTSAPAPSSTPTPAPTSAPAPTSGAGTNAATAAAPASGVAYTVAVTLQVSGTVSQVMAFDTLLQNGTRLFLATSLGFGTSTATTKTTGSASTTTVGDVGTLTGYVFVVSGSSAIPVSAPAPTATPTPTPGPTGTPIPTGTPTPTATPKP
jgi:hypothetical protein